MAKKGHRFVQMSLNEGGYEDMYLDQISKLSGLAKAQILRMGIQVMQELERLEAAGYKVSDDLIGIPVDMLLPISLRSKTYREAGENPKNPGESQNV